ncbi:MAG: hypothetical protein WBF27_23370 [Xanthobacteraceae bacterium]
MPGPPAAEIVPPSLTMPPVNVVTSSIARAIPAAAEISPALLMPPVNVGPVILTAVWLDVTAALRPTAMPRADAEMTPLSVMPPLMVAFWMAMPVAAAIVPEFEIAPINVEIVTIPTLPGPPLTVAVLPI